MVVRLSDCRLRLVDREWLFASGHAEAISKHWDRSIASNPKLFNGNVFVTERWSVTEGVLVGDAVAAKFSAYLYWRDHGFDEGATGEAFVTSVVVAADGGVLLVRAMAGTLNAGLYLPPGGLVDQRDAGADGHLDLSAAAARELREETGLALDPEPQCEGELVRRDPGFLFVDVSPFLCVASVFRSALPGADLVAGVERFLARQGAPEVEACRIIYNSAELDELPATRFARLLTSAVLA